MGVKKKTRSGKRKQTSTTHQYEITGIFLFLFGVFLCISLTGQDLGILGSWMEDTLHFLFGSLAVIPSIFLVYMGARYVYRGRGFSLTKRGCLWGALYVLALGWIHHWETLPGRELTADSLSQCGGIIGGVLVWGLHILFGSGIGTTLVLFALSASGILLMTHWSLTNGMQLLGAKTETKMKHVHTVILEKKAAWEEQQRLAAESREPAEEENEPPKGFLFQKKEKQREDPVIPSEIPEVDPVSDEAPETEIPDVESDDETAVPAAEKRTEPADEAPEPAEIQEKTPGTENPAYRLPPLSLLHEGTQTSGSVREEARKNVQVLESTLRSFGVSVRITDVSVGPTVTRYELEPAPGVKVSRITNLQDDIALQLAATHIRIEAPIPGKSAVGIEVPNEKTAEVALRDVLDDSSFKNRKGGVPVALGKDITGRPVVTDLTKMPHLLIAGSTGSGKSVCINTIIMSILFHQQPDDVKLILIDPKVVELSVYNGIPHLRIPVVTEAKKAAGALQWAVREMESRYQQFSYAHVRDIGGYNKLNPEQRLPFIVIIIDELADLMMAASDSVEDAICRLAQKARAAGIHLVLATQRPSVDVITGVIKANIPSRISFAVSSQVDSRTILDMAGAEKLIGKGDMLFNPIGAANPVRVQGAFVSDEEVEAVANYIKTEAVQGEVRYEAINLDLPEKPERVQEAEQEDELLQEAAEWILDTKKASVSMLQRRFRIGYTRAGRLMDTLEHMGIVGPADGAKPRDILMTREEAESRFFQEENKQP